LYNNQNKEFFMKKMLWVLGAVSAALLVAGCGTTSSGTRQSSRVTGLYGDPAPDWVGKGRADTTDAVYFVGYGREGKTVTAKQASARANGLQQLADWKKGKVSAILEDYVNESGETGNTQSLESLQNGVVARSSANTSGFRQVESWVDQNGQFVILFSYPTTDFKNDFKAATNEFVRNESALYAEFKADQMFSKLEENLPK
jgi:hypothetical protein